MLVRLEDIGKRFTTGWVFKGMNHLANSGDCVAITGPNGSGKSTLLNIISGYLSYTKGQLTYDNNGMAVERDDIYKHTSIAAAYAELDEELTARELFEHYRRFKPFTVKTTEDFLHIVELQEEVDKQVRYYSSGMKQRLNLALALCMDTPLLLLDEPTSFLDDRRKEWFHKLMNDFGQGRTTFIASNDVTDLKTCSSKIVLG